MKLRLLLTLLLLCSIGSLKAQTETYYTARVSGLTEHSKENALNTQFSGLEGISLFRADYRTETVYLIFSNTEMTEQQIVQLLEQQNVMVICAVVQNDATNIRQKLFSKCFKEEHVEPQIQKQ